MDIIWGKGSSFNMGRVGDIGVRIERGGGPEADGNLRRRFVTLGRSIAARATAVRAIATYQSGSIGRQAATKTQATITPKPSRRAQSPPERIMPTTATVAIARSPIPMSKTDGGPNPSGSTIRAMTQAIAAIRGVDVRMADFTRGSFAEV